MNRILSKEEKDLFESILGSSQAGLMNSLIKLLPDIYGEDKMIITEDYIMALGDIPLGLVAHMDTVHAVPVQDLFHDQEKNIFWSPQGLGADDRAGVYAMIEILRRGHRPTLILTTDEEKGGIGAGKLVSDFPKEAPCTMNFLIELDRRGSEDCVFYDCENPDFETYIEDYGFRTSWGSFSDISVLCPVWGMAGVNLSIGYYNEHTKHEFLSINDMFATIDKVCNLMDDFKEEDKFEYIESKKSAYGYEDSWYTPMTGTERYLTSLACGYNDYSGLASGEEELCWGCLATFEKEMLVPYGDGQYCGDCFSEYFTTCVECKSSFEDRSKTHLQCEKCREVL